MALAAVTVACGTLSGVSAVDEPAGDAGTPTPDGRPDGAPPSDDASTDAGASCGYLEGGFCAQQMPAPAFCADFDNPACTLLGFTGDASCSGVTIVVDDKHHESTPNALHGTQDGGALAVQESCGETVSFVVPTPASSSTVEIDLEYRVPKLPTVASTRIGPIHIDATKSGGPTVDFWVESNKSYFTLLQADGGIDYSNEGLMTTTDAWRSLSFVFTVQANGSSSFTGHFEDEATPPFENHPMDLPLHGGQTVTITVGYAELGLTVGEIHVDNLAVRVTP